ncbi:MAG: LTA synthase family protein [Bacteroidales bacterium]|jgi:arylsulfatase A-like enzyme|nr:LTA synthase family protein [Bacteroidales bacterium]
MRLFKRILVVYLLFTLCRVVFLLYNDDFYSDRSFVQMATIFAGGLLFDTTAILYTNLPYLFMFLIPFKFRYNVTYQRIGKYLYLIMNGAAVAANLMDTVYFRFTMRRTTSNVFGEFSHGEEIGKILLQAFADNWYLVLVFFALMALMAWCYGRLFDRRSIRLRHPLAYYSTGLAVMALCTGVIVIGLRGGIRHSTRPITLSNAGEYAYEPIDVPLVVNTPFSLYKTLHRKGIVPLKYFDGEEAMRRIYSPVHLPDSSASFRRLNVMVIIMESFGKEHFGFYNRHLEDGAYKGYTPFLDSLASQSLTFEYSYANGGKSIDALASALAGIPAIPEPFVLSPHFDNTVRGLPLLLREKGYETAFFCGQPNSAMGFWAFCRMMGVERQFGMNEYGNNDDYDGIWGIWDEEFLQFTAQQMTALREPFFVTLFTVSSHHPFKVPERYETTFDPGTLPIHRCIRYSDYALRRFFATAKRQPWFDSTLFVLMSDHVNGIVHKEYKPSYEGFAIPILFYLPGHPKDTEVRPEYRKVAQQIDVMPTVLGILRYDEPYFAFGFDLTRVCRTNGNSCPANFAVNYTNGYYQIYKDGLVLIWDGKETVGLYRLHDANPQDMKGRQETAHIQNDMETCIKAFLQQYTAGMAENSLILNHNH